MPLYDNIITNCTNKLKDIRGGGSGLGSGTGIDPLLIKQVNIGS